ncbi:MAG: alpha-galactosidase [Phycisphaera sp.]|nr:alpha-galactosidase [Phycisphaera sp.]
MGQFTSVHGIEVRLSKDPAPFTATLSTRKGEAEGIYFVDLALRVDTPAPLPRFTIEWLLPSIDFHHKWNSRCMQNRALDVGLGSFNRIESAANSGMPVFSLYNLAGVNACTFALSDVVHDTRMGGDYGNGKFFRCNVDVVGNAIGVVDRYELSIRFDFRPVPYHVALRDVASYWQTLPGCTPCAVPESARKPLLSSWYIYLVDFDTGDFEKQCELAKDLGFGTAILDDGWQTRQREPGYQNNGDWEVCEEKLPDLIDHVRRVQALGLKYMVWFSVPYIGVESKAYHRFKDMLTPGRAGSPQYAIDLRFPEARRYLIDIYESFVKRYGVDGLKLDFIDSVGDRDPSADILADGRRDTASMGEAVCALLDEATARLRRLNPDFLIEFRQAYTGPAMRRYANMLRAVDCANSLGDNRVRTLDLRLLSGDTAVHSDPITWHNDEPDHSAAMQIIHALFSVPQISMKLSELGPSHLRMLRYQLEFVRAHAEVLQTGELRPLFPHLLYPLVTARDDRKLLAAFYADMPLRLDEPLPPTLILINGCYAKELLLELKHEAGEAEVVVKDCCGADVSRHSIKLTAGFNRLVVPPAGNALVRQ